MADQIKDTLEATADHIKGNGLDVVETVPNPQDTSQAFVVTKHGRPPCILEKNQISNLVLAGLDSAVSQHNCHYLPKRLMMIKQELKPKIQLIN